MATASFLRRFSPDLVLWAASVSSALAVGLCGGATFGFFLRAEAAPPVVFSASGSSVTTVVLEGFRDGALRGQAAGPLRLYATDDEIAVGPDGRFSIVHPGFRIEDVTVPVPPGMRFVASRKGKKYYAVDSAAGERIAPGNRVYFPDAASAERAGFAK